VLVSFMERFHGNTFKWPNKKDILNVVKDDILFISIRLSQCSHFIDKSHQQSVSV
jgi:hypothetical protein